MSPNTCMMSPALKVSSAWTQPEQTRWWDNNELHIVRSPDPSTNNAWGWPLCQCWGSSLVGHNQRWRPSCELQALDYLQTLPAQLLLPGWDLSVKERRAKQFSLTGRSLEVWDVSAIPVSSSACSSLFEHVRLSVMLSWGKVTALHSNTWK